LFVSSVSWINEDIKNVIRSLKLAIEMFMVKCITS